MIKPRELAQQYATLLEKHYEAGFGISPAAEPQENFYRQVWVRDFAHAAAHYFISARPQAVEDSLGTIFRHQRPDGALPLRVEREYLLLKLTPGLRFFAKPLFNLIEHTLRGRQERPVYSGQDFSSAEDTIPAVLLVAGLYEASGERGKAFMSRYREQCRRALEYFSKKGDQEGLISVKSGNVDWADSISRGGTLGFLNVLWVQALKYTDTAAFERARAALLRRLYDRGGAYFRATEGENRLDTAATILGALFFLDAAECARAAETLQKKVLRASGIANFDPPYPSRAVRLWFKLIGHGRYHNAYVWPWLTLQYVHLKIKIAREHADHSVRERYRLEALRDVEDMARLFEESGGAYEIYFPDTRQPAQTRFYHPPRYFLASMAGFVSACRSLEKLDKIHT